MVRTVMKWFLLLTLALPVLLLLAGQAGLLRGAPPGDLGVSQGRLKALSNTPNCVSSQAHLYPGHPQQTYAQIDPLPLKAAGPQASLSALSQVLQAMNGVTVTDVQRGYVRAEARTRWLKFTDDLEFWVNPERQVIEVRSASRLGQMDFATNRSRIEALRPAYLAL